MNNFKLNSLKLKFIIIISFVIFFLPVITQAATFGFLIDKENPVVGDKITVDLKIDSEDTSINAAQATIKFPSNILKVESLIKTDSIFNFWLAEPSSDNDLGEVSFIGGSTVSGYSGKSLQVIRIRFKVIGNGTANLVFSDTAISSADGSGSNVLSTAKGTSFVVLGKSEINKIEQPQITREAELASKLSTKPVLSVPLYPDPQGWYNLISDFSVNWDLPKDVTNIATSVDKIPNTAPTKSEGLFDNKVFKALDNGVWYVHVRFKNNIGWGQTNHYRIAIDSVPPLPFKAEILNGEVFSNNPTPTISFESTDQFSGIGEYLIRIDDSAEFTTDKKEYVLPNLFPGKHVIKVVAKDKAGNATESSLNIETLPINPPKILSSSKNIYIGEGGVAISGSSSLGTSIFVDLKNSKNQSVQKIEIGIDENGFWSTSLDAPREKGMYVLEVVAKDSRGARSFPVLSDQIKLSERPVLVIGGIALTYKLFLFSLIIIVLISFALGFYTKVLAKNSRQRRILIAERDVNSQLLSIKKDISKILDGKKISEDMDNNTANEVNYILKKIDENIDKNKEYILENIGEIG